MTAAGNSGARGGLYTIVGQLTRMIIGLGTSAIIARLVTPTDFGYMAMVLAIIGVSEVVRDFGLYNAAIQSPQLSRGQQSNLFWINFALGGGLACTVIAASPLIAALYRQEELIGITLALAPVFVLNGAATQFRAKLTRDSRFGTLSLAEVATQVIGAGVGVTLAFAGLGYWALVWQQVVFALAGLLLVVFAARWMPSLPRRGVPVRDLIRFGSNTTGQQLLNYLVRNVDSVAIGRVWGPALLGQYDRAYQILMLPIAQINAPLTRVALPILSRAVSRGDDLIKQLGRAQAVSLYLTVPVFCALASSGDKVVIALFGSQWVPAGVILQVLAIGGIFRALMQVTYWAYLATARTGQMLRFDLVALPFLALLILGGTPWGPLGVAVTHSVGYGLYWLFGLLWMGRVASLDVLPLVKAAVGAVAFVGAPVGLAAYAASFSVTEPLMAALLAGAASLFVLALAAIYYRPMRISVRETLQSLRGESPNGPR